MDIFIIVHANVYITPILVLGKGGMMKNGALKFFLSTMDVSEPKKRNIANLRKDARIFNWDKITVHAILEGINLVYDLKGC